jgi:hypothetical protein
MTIRRGFYASLLASLVAAIVFVLAPSATAFDPTELSLAVDAVNTYAPDLDSPSPPNDGAHDFAVGGGQHGDSFTPNCSNSTGTCVNEGFSAHSGPNGENPQGHVSATFITPHPAKLRGPVLCVNVQGNMAFILVLQQQDETDLGFPPNQPFLLVVVDNGNPVLGTPPDMIRNYGPDDFTPGSGTGQDCGTPSGPPGMLQKGNIVVRDVS